MFPPAENGHQNMSPNEQPSYNAMNLLSSFPSSTPQALDSNGDAQIQALENHLETQSTMMSAANNTNYGERLPATMSADQPLPPFQSGAGRPIPTIMHANHPDNFADLDRWVAEAMEAQNGSVPASLFRPS